MKKRTIIVIIAFVGVMGMLVGYIIGRNQALQIPRVITMRYSDLGPVVPDVIERVEASYPKSALKDRFEGTVYLKATIGDDGSVTSVDVMKSARRDLDDAAKEAVLQWKFRPTIENGKPTSIPFIVPFTFKLDTSKATQ